MTKLSSEKWKNSLLAKKKSFIGLATGQVENGSLGVNVVNAKKMFDNLNVHLLDGVITLLHA